jgi:Amt family ammonium transporter
VFAAPSLGGTGVYDYVANAVNPDYSIAAQVWIQCQAVITTVVWSAVVSLIAYKVVDLLLGLRVSEEDERMGLDISAHGESAYNR